MTVHRVDQGMAAAAARSLPDNVDKELRTRYRQLRVMLHTAGLAATYAFIASKAGGAGGETTTDDPDKLARAYRDAAAGIRARLADLGVFSRDVRPMGVRDFMTELGGMDSVRYARASAEASAFVGWLSRLADATWQERDERA
jgi:CRISPR/Cas system CMR-associated protein Cmr5 small subunit